MLTRQWYMSNEGAPDDKAARDEWRRAKHESYFGEIAQASRLGARNLPTSLDDIRAALALGDFALNSIPLHLWDASAAFLQLATLKSRGESDTLGVRVCVLKALARRLVSLSTSKESQP